MLRAALRGAPHSERQEAPDQRLRQLLQAAALPERAQPRLRLRGHALRRPRLRPQHTRFGRLRLARVSADLPEQAQPPLEPRSQVMQNKQLAPTGQAMRCAQLRPQTSMLQARA